MKRSLNIAIFSDNYFPQISGVSTAIDVIDKELTKLGHNVYIFANHYPGDYVDKKNVFRLRSIPFFLDKACRIGSIYSHQAMQKIRQSHIDIIHTHTEFSIGVFGRIVANQLNIPLIHTYHTMYEDWSYNNLDKTVFSFVVAKSITKYTKNHCDDASEIIVPSLKVKEFLEKNKFESKISVLPSGIDLVKFNMVNEEYDQAKINNFKKELGFSPDDKIILNLGRVSKEKNIEAIINAMPQIVDKKPNAKLVVIGDGPNRMQLEDLVEKLSLQNCVVFLGKKSKEGIEKYYKIADFFVTASTFETQGLTVMEAMAAEIPVVLKKDKAFEGVIEHNKTGFIFEKDDDLAGLMLSIWDNTELLTTVKQNMRKKITEFSATSFAKNIEGIYLRNSNVAIT